MDPSKNEFSRFRGDVTVRAFSKGIFFRLKQSSDKNSKCIGQ